MKSFLTHHLFARSRYGLATMLALVALLLVATQARAHNVTPNDASPAPGKTLAQSPSVVTLRFEEELISESSSIQVVDASGAPVDDGDGGIDLTDPDHATLVVHLSKPLSDGVYTVRYQATVLDGDATVAEFQFAVGQSDVAPSHEIKLSSLDESKPEPEQPQSPNLALYAGVAVVVLLLIIGLAVVLRQSRSSSST